MTTPFPARAMRIELLGDMDLVYRDSTFGQKFHLVRPFGSEEGWGYGEGEGTIKGEKLSGKIRWVSHPRHRGDGSVLPSMDGAIKTEDGAIVLFTLQGRTVWVKGMGRQLMSVTFASDDHRYKWVNDAFCVLEGAVDHLGLRIRSHLYLCVNEMV
jgi:hypothetical protein